MRIARMVLPALALGGVALLLVPDTAEAQRRQRDVITKEEIAASAHRELDLYQVVRSLRPHFLTRPRGNRSMGGAMPGFPILYVNGNRQAELENGLKVIAPDDVEEVRYLEPARAQDQFGIDHSGGAVLVTLRTGVGKPPQ
jgi:hypothetical protein